MALTVQGFSKTPLDCSLWKRAAGLKYLDLKGQTLQNPAQLANYPALAGC